MILEDNSVKYLAQLSLVIEHSDPRCDIVAHQGTDGLSIIITPSDPLHKQQVIENILFFHKRIHIKTEFSKSGMIQKTIIFKVPF